VVAIALLLVVITTGFVHHTFMYEGTDDAQIEGHVRPLSARINGQVREVHVIECQFVHAGDMLVVINPRDYQIAVDQARANLADTEASAARKTFPGNSMTRP
jgi:membrane fusion protein (multidrug efflux system)